MKQTATDYLYDQFLKAFIEYVEDKIDGAKFSELMIEARVKSQIMEKQQISDAYIYARISRGSDTYLDEEANKYFYQTFKQ